jgi:hypothetical protein
MALRPSLLYQPPRSERVEAFLQRALEIAAFVEVGIDPSDLLAEFNEAAGRPYRPEALLFLLRGGDLPALALEAAVPPPAIGPDLSRAELIDLLGLIRTSEPPQSAWYIDLFETAVGRPEAAALLFWPPDKWTWRRSGRKLTEWHPSAEEVVDLVASS